MLLVGESGLGKTTFVRNLFAAFARDASFPINDASAPNAPRVRAAALRGGRWGCCSGTQRSSLRGRDAPNAASTAATRPAEAPGAWCCTCPVGGAKISQSAAAHCPPTLLLSCPPRAAGVCRQPRGAVHRDRAAGTLVAEGCATAALRTAAMQCADSRPLPCPSPRLQDSENKIYFHYLIQDTPGGFGAVGCSGAPLNPRSLRAAFPACCPTLPAPRRTLPTPPALLAAGYGDSTNLAGDRRAVLDYVEDCCCAYLHQVRRCCCCCRCWSRALGLCTAAPARCSAAPRQLPGQLCCHWHATLPCRRPAPSRHLPAALCPRPPSRSRTRSARRR